MKKKDFIKIICLLIVVVAYFGYKAIILYSYKVDTEGNEEHQSKLLEQLRSSGDIINIKLNDDVDQKNIAKFEDISYQSLGGKFVLNKEKSSTQGAQRFNSYYYNGKDAKPIAVFNVGKSDYSYYDMIAIDEISTFGFSFKVKNRRDLLEKNNITNDYDLAKYIINHYEDRVNVFSSANKIKLDYLVKTFTNVVFPVSKIYLIEGDLKGFMLVVNDNYLYEIHVVNGEDNYWFTFINSNKTDYFKSDDIKEFLSNINFKES